MNTDISITKRGFWIIVSGVVVMILGFILMAGGGVEDPQVFNYEMFNARRLVVAPLAILVGVILVGLGIMEPKFIKKDKK